MLTRLHLSGVKSFSQAQPVTLEPDRTKRFLVFYGLNGAGKTAVGQVLARNGNGVDPIASCSVACTRDDIRFVVYNEEFIEENFRGKQGFPGIFTLGKQEVDSLKREEELLAELSLKQGSWNERKNREKLVEQSLNEETLKIQTKVWAIVDRYKNTDLSFCLEGFRSSKTKLFENLLSFTGSEGDLEELISQLSRKAKPLLTEDVTYKSLVTFDLSALQRLVMNEIWAEPMSSASEAGHAKLVERLNAWDWLRTGSIILRDIDVCPLCYRSVSEEIKEQVISIVDEFYSQDAARVSGEIDKLKSEFECLRGIYENYCEKEERFSGSDQVENAWLKLCDYLQKFLVDAEKKKNTPSLIVSQSGFESVLREFLESVEQVNEGITQYNEFIENKDAEIKGIKERFWQAMRQSYSEDIERYFKAVEIFSTEKKDIAEELSLLHADILKLQADISLEKAKSGGIASAIADINSHLSSIGITDFSLAQADEGSNLYCLDRVDVGKDEYSSLSEGEKTLLTFFYFLSLVSGSFDEEDNVPLDHKIVVIDDPISSLSHNYIYDISSLISGYLSSLTVNDKRIRQIIVLTHSLFFFHEISKQFGAKKCQFFRVLKNEYSFIEEISSSDIKNEYESYWQVLRDARIGQAPIVAVPNAMRCIIEHFFYFVRRESDLDKVVSDIEGRDRKFAALGRFINRKSHSDAVNITDFGDYDVEYFLQKFEQIFDETGFAAHFAEMFETPGSAVDAAV